MRVSAMLICGIDPGVRDLATCLIRFEKGATPEFVVLDWRVTNLAEFLNKARSRKPSSGWDVPVEDAVSAAVNFVQDLTSKTVCDRQTVFVIERQFMNQRLVALSHALQASLETLGFRSVKFVHSMMRFNVVGHYKLLDDLLATTGNVKKRSLYLANHLLAQDPKKQTQLATAQACKRDDLSDAFLFALAWANDNK